MTDTPTPSSAANEVSKLRLEDAAIGAANPFNLVAVRADHLAALIDLLRAARREVRCTCAEDYTVRKLHDPDCIEHSLCPDTAAELERWE